MTVPYPAPALHFPELSPTERRIAFLLMEDASTAIIAGELGCKAASVSTAKCRLLAKLGLDGVAGLTKLAVREGWVTP